MRRKHWDKVCQERVPDVVIWYQLGPTLSLDPIAAPGIGKEPNSRSTARSGTQPPGPRGT
jgi:hypothetical protein